MAAMRFAHAPRWWLFLGHSNQGEQWLTRTLARRDNDEGDRPGPRAGHLDRQPAAHRPARGGHLRARTTPAPPGRAVAPEPLRHGADGRPGGLGHRRRQRAARRLARGRRPGPRPPGAAHRRRHRRRALRRPAGLPRGRRRSRGPRSSCSSPARSRSASRSTRSASPPPERSRSRVPPCGPGPAPSWPPPRRPPRWLRSSCSSTSPASPPRCTPASRSTRTARSTSCRARWPPSSRTPSPACTAAVRPTGGSCSRPVRRSCRCRSTWVRPSTPAPSARFLERGGWVAWGAVPTTGPLGRHPRAALAAAVGRVVRAHPGRLRPRPAPRAGADHPGLRAGQPRRGQADLVLSLTNQVRPARLADRACASRHAPHLRSGA